MKKFLSLLLSMIILISVIAGADLNVFAASYTTIATARNISIGSTYSGKLVSDDKIDYYKFTISTSSKVSLKMNSSISTSVNIAWYDADGNELAYNRPEASSAGVISFTKDLHLLKGTYYIKFESYYYAYENQYGSYSFSLNSTSANETFSESGNGTNNTMSTANEVSFQKTYYDQFAINDKVDFYKFTIPKSSLVTLRLKSDIFTSINVTWYDINGNEIVYDRPAADSSGRIASNRNCHLLKGTYYIKFESYYYAYDDQYGNYNFSLEYESANETFTESVGGNNSDSMSKAYAVSFGIAYNDQLAINDKVDFYKFTLPSSSELKFKLKSSVSSSINVTLYDEGGNEIIYVRPDADSSGTISYEKSWHLIKGTYYIKFESYYYAYENQFGNYSLLLSYIDSKETYTESVGGHSDDKISSANLISLGTTYNGQLAVNDEDDYYKFILNNNSNVNFCLNSRIPSDVEYYIYDANGTELYYEYVSINSSGSASKKTEYFLKKGTYYLRIHKYYYAYESGYGNYSFKLCAHKMVKSISAATLSKNGTIITKCSLCGETISKQTIYYPKTISLSATSYTYDGKTKTPSVKVVGSNGKAISSSNYTVSYARGRKYVGKYAVKITFKGNYSGSKTLYFTIKPKTTSISSISAGSKKFTVKWKKQSTQTTGYQIQYSTSSKFTNAKTVTVSKNSTTSKTISKLSGKKKYYVRVRTYKKVGSTNYYSSWSSAKSVSTKK